VDNPNYPTFVFEIKDECENVQIRATMKMEGANIRIHFTNTITNVVFNFEANVKNGNEYIRI
jgi:hypothetical protein